jgi:hypothetical protein
LPLRILFITVAFVNSALIFWVQPMIGKMLLPTLGGAPAVWNTCLVFFQAALLVGYTYAYLQSRLSLRARLILYSVLIGGCVFLLPPDMPTQGFSPSESNPFLWLLITLTMRIGLPFAVLSAAAPMLQDWFRFVANDPKEEPYFLYAASNAGSILGLISYPLVIEAGFRLNRQSFIWSSVFVVVAAVIILIAAFIGTRTQATAHHRQPKMAAAPVSSRLKWLLSAILPSALLQSVTTHITTDIAAVPLLWTIPLVLYLLSFVFAFSPRNPVSEGSMRWIQPACAVAVILWTYWFQTDNLLLSICLDLALLFSTSLLCNMILVRNRPEPGLLTEFYLWIALGGVMGGALNAIVAPLVFNSLAEHVLTILAAALLVPISGRKSDQSRGLYIELAAAILLIPTLSAGMWLFKSAHGNVLPVLFKLAIGAGAVVALLLTWNNSRRMALLMIGILLVGAASGTGASGKGLTTLLMERNFFGLVRVRLDRNADWTTLMHGTTLHGSQYLLAAAKREPTCYHAKAGPLGDVFRIARGYRGALRVGVAGLGAGTMAAYSMEGDDWTFYEIDPLVLRIAGDPKYFSFLSGSEAKMRVVLGDARLALKSAPDNYFDLLVLDAFSSDSIPVHLLTKEAVELYLSKLKPDGLIVFNITNRYLDFVGLLAGAAQNSGLHGLIAKDSKRPKPTGYCASSWVVLTKYPERLKPFVASPRWGKLDLEVKDPVVWSDDFSNLVPCLKWDKLLRVGATKKTE